MNDGCYYLPKTSKTHFIYLFIYFLPDSPHSFKPFKKSYESIHTFKTLLSLQNTDKLHASMEHCEMAGNMLPAITSFFWTLLPASQLLLSLFQSIG